ncbi:phage tail protein [Citrobacter portucalensis]|uniref:phage tail protein n=1 Tax=Citrobacter portucalensis TaxID=1639133 RepID=UPI003314980B
MSTKFKTIITTAGAAKLAAATLPGGKKVNITVMAVGDGDGSLPEPNASQTKLINEVWRHALNKISQDNRNSNYIVAELVIPPEVGGFWMRELGLYDDEGALIAVANMAESYKPELAEGSGRAQTCRMVIIVSSIASVELSIDSTMVMATQDYVDDKIAEHEKSRNHPDATLKEKGFTQLSSATDSASESFAATPKAVKTAYDLADGKYTAQDASTAQKGIVQLNSATDSSDETQAATPKAVKIVMDNANARLAKERNGADIPNPPLFVQNIGLQDTVNKAAGAVQRTGDTMSGKLNLPQTSSFGVNTDNALGGNSIVIGDSDTGFKQESDGVIGIYSNYQKVCEITNALFTALVNFRIDGGLTTKNIVALDGDIQFASEQHRIYMPGVDDAGFNGNNLVIQSWFGIGLRCSMDHLTRIYFNTRDGSMGLQGEIRASGGVKSGDAKLETNGDVYGDIWGGGSGPGWLSAVVATKPGRQYITQIGVYQNDKTKPFMLHDDGSGVFLATQEWVLQNFVQSIDLTAPAEVGFWDNNTYLRATDGAAMYNFRMVGGSSNVGNFIIRYMRKQVNNTWYVIN